MLFLNKKVVMPESTGGGTVFALPHGASDSRKDTKKPQITPESRLQSRFPCVNIY
jgi:hypothetical protein